MASREAQEAGRGVVSGVEGISTRVPFVGGVNNIINDLSAGLRSALSYTGVETSLTSTLRACIIE
jgi:IMP dehydrogenase/GMP reductase